MHLYSCSAAGRLLRQNYVHSTKWISFKVTAQILCSWKRSPKEEIKTYPCVPKTYVPQSQKNHGSVVALLSGKFLQIRKVFATWHIFSQNCLVGKETVRMVRKLSGQSINCLNNLETVWTTQNCPDNSKTVRTI